MLKRIRTILALVFFIGITLLFLDFTGTAHRWLGWMAKVQFLPAIMALNAIVVIALIVLTLIFGRIYCSVICPLGVFQDVIAWFGKKAKKNRYSYSRALSWLRYTVLGVFIVAFLAGIGSIVQLLAPYSAYGRIATTIFQPLWKLCNNGLAAIAERIDSYAFYSVDVLVPSIGLVLVIADLTVLVLIPLAWNNGRTYCNTICPVGTVLSFFARFSWLKIHIDEEKCRNCSLCSKNCKAACIDFKNHTIDASRCVVCGDCIGVCNHHALKYDHAWAHSKKQEKKTDDSKRSFLIATAALAYDGNGAGRRRRLTEASLRLRTRWRPRDRLPSRLRARSPQRTLQTRCTGCQLCISECPNQVLRPSDDLMHLMMPVMSYERGYCRPECNRCSEVCPAGAIKPISHEDKASTQIGHAVWIKKNCLVLTDGVDCGNCERHCPTVPSRWCPATPTTLSRPMSLPSTRALHRLRCLREPMPGTPLLRHLRRRPRSAS